MINAVRRATPADNDALVALSVACPMEGEIGLAVDRAPDFFALNRLEGASWQVGVVDGPGGRPVGCIAVAQRTVYVNGEPTGAMYVSDLKVHPAHRGAGVADLLTGWAGEIGIAAWGEDGLAFLTVLGDNRSMARRMAGPRGLPHLERVATYRTFTIPLLWRRAVPQGCTITAADTSDLEEMAELWAAVAPRRHLTPAHDADDLGAWIEAAPDLEVASYRLARRGGRIVGFLAPWDQSGFKKLRVTGYTPKLAGVRAAFNAIAPLVRATRLPPPGGALENVTAVHLCVPPDDPAVLRALVLDAYNASRGAGSFLNVGLDAADPLAVALKGLFAQPLDIWVCVASLADRPSRRSFDGRPFHHEIALV